MKLRTTPRGDPGVSAVATFASLEFAHDQTGPRRFCVAA
jgi:hypothetical protein